MSIKRGNRRMFNSSKGQVTIFIIIGIVLLFTFAGILYFTNTSVKDELTATGQVKTTSVPTTFKPITTYTETCLYNTAKDALVLLGEQGGYIYPEVLGEYSSTKPTESDGISLEPINVPYWHYNVERNDADKVVMASFKPQLYAKDDPQMSIESQLSRYVKENVENCLIKYQPFYEKGFVIDDTEIEKLVVNIGDNLIGVSMKKNIEISKGDAETEIENFYIQIPLALKRYYNLAETITNVEVENNFLERQGLEVLSVYSRIDPEYFPPTSDVTYELFSPYSWSESNLERKYQELLTSYVPMLRYLGSANFYQPTYSVNEPLAQRTVDNMVLPLLGAEDLEVSFDYFGWQPYFKTNSLNGVIKPESFSVKYFILNVGQQRYETHYDISYPVLVSVTDEYAFDGEGYEFVFALESNIRNNQPAENNDVYDTYPVNSVAFACDEQHRDSPLLKTVVVDSFTKEPLESVKIGFSIPQQMECDIGLTDSVGIVESKYPSVYGGQLTLLNNDYLPVYYPLDTYNYENEALVGYSVAGLPESERVIEMHKIKQVNVSIMKKNIKKCIGDSCFHSGLLTSNNELHSYIPEMLSKKHWWTFSGGMSPLSGERATLVLERVGDYNDDGGFSDEFIRFVSFEPGETNKLVDLVPGKYIATATIIIDGEPVIFPKAERCTGGVIESLACWNPDGCCYDIDEMNSEAYTSGQLEWNTPKTILEVTPDQLYSSNKITFYVPNQDILSVPEEENVRVIEDLRLIGELVNISQMDDVRRMLEPKFS